MAIPDSGFSDTRSDRRIPNLRSRGRANRQKLLAAAERLVEETGDRPIRFSDVFTAADVSRGSAYRIYNGLDDLMQDLASTWINNFVDYIYTVETGPGIETWQQLSDRIIELAAAYWRDTEVTLRVLPRVRSNIPQSYREASREASRAISKIFERHFAVPPIPDWMAIAGMYTQIGDLVFSDAVRRDGRISKARVQEAQKLCKTYLSTYLPPTLPAKNPAPPQKGL